MVWLRSLWVGWVYPGIFANPKVRQAFLFYNWVGLFVCFLILINHYSNYAIPPKFLHFAVFTNMKGGNKIWLAIKHFHDFLSFICWIVAHRVPKEGFYCVLERGYSDPHAWYECMLYDTCFFVTTFPVLLNSVGGTGWCYFLVFHNLHHMNMSISSRNQVI